MISEESLNKLQEILSKRFGRPLTKEELKIAYERLMRFAFTLVDLQKAIKQ